MAKHLFGLVVTAHGTAANNRAETEGNITTLQKILWKGEVHTTVSAEAIRFAIRWYWQRALGEDKLNRVWEEGENKPLHEWKDHRFDDWEKYLDDDVLGFMSAEAAKEEANPGEAGGNGKKKRGTTIVRRSRLEVTRAISLTPFAGDITFNAASVNATPSASSTGKDPVPYGTEVHATRYQYGFALTPEDLHDKTRALHVLDAIVNLSDVAGNQARFLFDFAPDSVIFRWTDDFAPRILYGFSSDDDGSLGIPDIITRVEAGDIAPEEIVAGGSIDGTSDGEKLKELKCQVYPGVKEAANDIRERLKKDLGLGATGLGG